MKESKNKKMLIGVVVVLLAIACAIIIFTELNKKPPVANLGGWVKNDRGIWTRNNMTTTLPKEVIEQKEAMYCAQDLFIALDSNGTFFESQCIGRCGNYSVDIVHAIRTEEDNLPENQCQDYLQGKTKYFIEMDRWGEILRIA